MWPELGLQLQQVLITALRQLQRFLGAKRTGKLLEIAAGLERERQE